MRDKYVAHDRVSVTPRFGLRMATQSPSAGGGAALRKNGFSPIGIGLPLIWFVCGSILRIVRARSAVCTSSARFNYRQRLRGASRSRRALRPGQTIPPLARFPPATA